MRENIAVCLFVCDPPMYVGINEYVCWFPCHLHFMYTWKYWRVPLLVRSAYVRGNVWVCVLISLPNIFMYTWGYGRSSFRVGLTCIFSRVIFLYMWEYVCKCVHTCIVFTICVHGFCENIWVCVSKYWKYILCVSVLYLSMASHMYVGIHV